MFDRGREGHSEEEGMILAPFMIVTRLNIILIFIITFGQKNAGRKMLRQEAMEPSLGPNSEIPIRIASAQQMECDCSGVVVGRFSGQNGQTMQIEVFFV